MYKTIVIDADLHKKLKNYCKLKKLKINEYVNELINIHLNFTLEEKSELPLILKNSKGEIAESIICSSLSFEFKNNMPKELTLIRTTKDGTGFIGNYNIK